MADDAKILTIAAAQDMVITRDDFLIHGTKHQLRYWIRCGRLVRRYENVYTLAGAELTWPRRLRTACYAGNRSGVASFRAAALLHHLPAGEEIVEITTRRHTRWDYPDVVVHESHHLTALDVVEIDGLPVTAAARTLCDLAALVADRRLPREQLDLALLEAVRRDLVDIRKVWTTRDRLGGSVRRGGDVMLTALQQFVPPVRRTESSGESRVLLLIRRHRFPEPTPQFWVQFPGGERVRLDFAWPEARVALEFDPYKYHGDRDRYERDAARTRKLQAIGWARVTVTDDELDAGMPQAVAALSALLNMRV